jgi:catechol-2,3-dioxygenase
VAPAGWRGVYHVAFNVPENQFAEAKLWLAARAPLIRDHAGREEFHFAGWKAHAVYCYDPAGNIIELIARHTLSNATDQPFTAASLLEISEIGLAVADVPAMVARLQAELGAAVYAGAGSADFTAVGDEHGLLIVVRQGRVWFATSADSGGAAETLPLSVTLTDAAGRRRTLSGPPYVIADE